MSIDHRVYVQAPGLIAGISESGAPTYCHRAIQGQYHLIAAGELFVSEGDACYCLNCGVESGLLTLERPNLDRANRVPN